MSFGSDRSAFIPAQSRRVALLQMRCNLIAHILVQIRVDSLGNGWQLWIERDVSSKEGSGCDNVIGS
jgi:hypothetical protein